MVLSPIFNRVVPFAAALAFGIVASMFWTTNNFNSETEATTPEVHLIGGGISSGGRKGEERPRETFEKGRLKIISKPKPGYTDSARLNNVQGKVVLRVVFLASGNIGLVEPISELPHGLTEKAIEAAKRIQFEPMIENGRPVSSIRTIEYSFVIY